MKTKQYTIWIKVKTGGEVILLNVIKGEVDLTQEQLKNPNIGDMFLKQYIKEQYHNDFKDPSTEIVKHSTILITDDCDIEKR